MAKKCLIKLYSSDAAHFIYSGYATHSWTKVRTSIPSFYGRQRVNALGFLDVITHEVISIVNETYINADVVIEGLEKLREENPEIEIVVILDNARYQHCKKVMEETEELGIKLVFLPAYSPNLNLIERLWKLLKNKILGNRYLVDFKTFKNTIKEALDNIHIRYKTKLDTLLTLNFELIDHHSIRKFH